MIYPLNLALSFGKSRKESGKVNFKMNGKSVEQFSGVQTDLADQNRGLAQLHAHPQAR